MGYSLSALITANARLPSDTAHEHFLTGIFMYKFIAVFLLFIPFAHTDVDMTNWPLPVPVREIVYSLVPPEGFESLVVTVQVDGKGISLIEVDTGISIHKIESSQLNIDFSPNLNEITFYQVGVKESIFFNIYHGAPKKTECGDGDYEYLQNRVVVTVYPEVYPLIENDDSHFTLCSEFTESQKRRNN